MKDLKKLRFAFRRTQPLRESLVPLVAMKCHPEVSQQPDKFQRKLCVFKPSKARYFMRHNKRVFRQIFQWSSSVSSFNKEESSLDVPVLLTTLFLRCDTPWRRKQKHRIGLKVTNFQIDFKCRIPFPVK